VATVLVLLQYRRTPTLYEGFVVSTWYASTGHAPSNSYTIIARRLPVVHEAQTRLIHVTINISRFDIDAPCLAHELGDTETREQPTKLSNNEGP